MCLSCCIIYEYKSDANIDVVTYVECVGMMGGSLVNPITTPSIYNLRATVYYLNANLLKNEMQILWITK